jgi:hypothetical protein
MEENPVKKNVAKNPVKNGGNFRFHCQSMDMHILVIANIVLILLIAIIVHIFIVVFIIIIFFIGSTGQSLQLMKTAFFEVLQL